MDETPDQKASEETEAMGFKASCSSIRGTIEVIKVCTLELKTHYVFNGKEDDFDNPVEMQANIQLAYRHLEDARMRLGKAIQAFEGGKSIYGD